jgi:hypothetical protein
MFRVGQSSYPVCPKGNGRHEGALICDVPKSGCWSRSVFGFVGGFVGGVSYCVR